MKRVFFWLLSLTWGSPMTLFGAFTALGLLLTGHRPHRFRFLVYFETGEHWGGFECGGFFVVQRGADDALKRHEAGHAVQNLIFGPLTPFLVSVSSAVRYWVRRGKIRRGKGGTLPPYDSIWFEKHATCFGEKYFE